MAVFFQCILDFCCLLGTIYGDADYDIQELLKLVSTIFYQIFIFHQMMALQKLKKKIFLFHLKSSFHSQDIQIFVFLPSPIFSPVSHCFVG